MTSVGCILLVNWARTHEISFYNNAIQFSFEGN